MRYSVKLITLAGLMLWAGAAGASQYYTGDADMTERADGSVTTTPGRPSGWDNMPGGDRNAENQADVLVDNVNNSDCLRQSELDQ